MALIRALLTIRAQNDYMKIISCCKTNSLNRFNVTRSKYSGIISPEPHKTSYGLLKIIFTVIPGLFIGAGISKSIANFLEENDLFVPSDDDDDDDDD